MMSCILASIGKGPHVLGMCAVLILACLAYAGAAEVASPASSGSPADAAAAADPYLWLE